MLKGERVTLRALERDDLPRWHELLNQQIDLVTVGIQSWGPRSLAAVEDNFVQNSAPDKPWFAIEADGRLIGTCGLKYWSWDQQNGTAELAISILDPAYVGQGYGREAINLLLDWGFRIQGWRRIWLDALAINERAIKAYRACGFAEEGRLRQHDWYNGAYVDVVIMGQLRTEWQARQRQ